jgi:hypothetical protein
LKGIEIKRSILISGLLFCLFFTSAGFSDIDYIIEGEKKLWHPVTITFELEDSKESGEVNPFLDRRLDVIFSKGDNRYRFPGYFAADGNAGETSAIAGNKWRVHFTPAEKGTWRFEAFFSKGENIAIKRFSGGKAICSGEFEVAGSDKKGRDFRTRGFLRYVGKRYFKLSGSGEYFLKGGADSPENFLGYKEFDGTFDTPKKEEDDGLFIHRYGEHVRDWRPGDVTWQGGKGKGIIGALNYLAGQGMNSVYFLTYNIDGGDGHDVWPWIGPEERLRFDCSKLDQWDIVFLHMDRLGLVKHVITQEEENDQGLDGGELGRQRKLYYRELVARFSYHPGLIWNLGEENTNTDSQRKAFADFIRELDPYDHPIVVHSFPDSKEKVYKGLLGFSNLEGASLQTNDTHSDTIKWIDLSFENGRQWVVFLDEIGPADVGVKPDSVDYEHKEVVHKHLWGNLLGGGGGVEWYFGYEFPHNDLNCEDWRSREHMWELTRNALDFFHEYLPFEKMTHSDDLVTGDDVYCFAQAGVVYAIFVPSGEEVELDLADFDEDFGVYWYDPQAGGKLQRGSIETVSGPGAATLGKLPDVERDWVCLVRSKE